MKSFIHKIQNSDEQTRKFWLFVLSAVSMVAVIGLWISYLNLTVARVTVPTSEERQVVQKPEVGGPGFFTIFSAGVKVIYDKIAEQLAVRHSIIIENPRKNFIADDILPVPATKLP